MAERGRMARARSTAAKRKPSQRRTYAQRVADYEAKQSTRRRKAKASERSDQYESRRSAPKPASTTKKAPANPRAARARQLAAARAERKANAPARTPANPRSARARQLAASRSAKPSTGRFGVGSAKTIMRNGKELANVSAEQLERTGLTLREYMNQWNRTGRRPR